MKIITFYECHHILISFLPLLGDPVACFSQVGFVRRQVLFPTCVSMLSWLSLSPSSFFNFSVMEVVAGNNFFFGGFSPTSFAIWVFPGVPIDDNCDSQALRCWWDFVEDAQSSLENLFSTFLSVDDSSKIGGSVEFLQHAFTCSSTF